MSDARPSAAIAGAVELFLGRREGLGRFDFSFEGFWRSFGAAVYALPLYAFVIAGEWSLVAAAPKPPALSLLIAARLADFVLDFAAMPAALALLARPLGISRSYAPYIVVRNWSTLVVLAPQAAISLLLRLGWLSYEISALLSLALLVVMLVYQFRIVRWTIGWTPGPAAAFVAADAILSLILISLVNALFGF
ncbi:MAG: hypothetical protein J0H54_12500 [Rhizobiales bacterium]|nr:hypothetical protein [Hyphomicrobiales bacterium]